MENKISDLGLAVYDGMTRFMIELMMIFDFILQDGKIKINQIKYDYISQHQSEMDEFLLCSNYYTIVEHHEEEPYGFGKSPEDEDIFIDCVPDLLMFKDDVEDIINHPSTENTKKEWHIIYNLYRCIYDAKTLDAIKYAKAKYLVTILSRILTISENADGVPYHISISGINMDVMSELYTGFANMLSALGCMPYISVPHNNDRFIKYLENYINAEMYYADGFVYGDSILRAYDTHVESIGWR